MRPTRDYRLSGAENARAIERGLADAPWWRPPVDEDRLAALMRRSNGRAVGDTALWLGLIVGLAVVIWITWFRWYSIPLLVVYGALYGGAADSRWHECGHGTAFRSNAANIVIYHIASFMLLREPTLWRWSHYRHHTDTIIVGRDAEILFPRPPRLARLPLTYSHLVTGPQMTLRMIRHAFGRIDPDARDFVPESEHRRLVWECRIFLAILTAAVGLSLLSWSPLPILLVGLPSIYGAWLVVFFGITQHAGLQEDVLDHRLNTRTVYMNPVFRWLYSNMNYHIEHHLFPGVPYHALPALHDDIKGYLPPPCPNTLAAYRELLGAMRRQQHDPSYELGETDRPIPDVRAAGSAPVDVGPIVDHPRAAGPVDLGAVSAVPIGRARRVDIGERSYALYRLAEHEVCVSDGLCTHGRAHLAEGAVLGSEIECPRHNGRFDLRTGAPTRKPATQPLRMYPCTVSDGRIWVDLATRSREVS